MRCCKNTGWLCRPAEAGLKLDFLLFPSADALGSIIPPFGLDSFHADSFCLSKTFLKTNLEPLALWR